MPATNLLKIPSFIRQQRRRNESCCQEPTASAEGRYFCPVCPMDGSHSLTSITSECSDDHDFVTPNCWISTEQQGYHKHSPLVPRGNAMTYSDEIQNLDIAMKRAAQLPRNSYFSSSHVMVNREREHRKVTPLKRCRELDELARWHVEAMAAAASTYHADLDEVLSRLPSTKTPCRRIGSNVAMGESIREIHKEMMTKRGLFNNICDRRYVEMGMATAKGPNDDLYICQFFRG